MVDLRIAFVVGLAIGIAIGIVVCAVIVLGGKDNAES